MQSAKKHLTLCTNGKNDSACTTEAKQPSLNSALSKKCSWNQNSSPSFATRTTLTKAGPKHNNTNNQIASASESTQIAFHLFSQSVRTKKLIKLSRRSSTFQDFQHEWNKVCSSHFILNTRILMCLFSLLQISLNELQLN